jgi:hypothetical protein
MIVAVTVQEIASGIVSIQFGAIVALALSLARTRERLAKLEEWARVHERHHNGKQRHNDE